MSFCFGSKKEKPSSKINEGKANAQATQQGGSQSLIQSKQKIESSKVKDSRFFKKGVQLQDGTLRHEVLMKQDIEYAVDTPKAEDLKMDGKKLQKIDVGVRTLQPFQMVRDSNYFDESREGPFTNALYPTCSYKTHDQTDVNKGLMIKRFIYDENATDLVKR